MRMNEEHKGFGGLYFLLINVLCALLMMVTLKLSYASQVVAMADNVAYITSINTSVYSYIAKEPAFSKTNPSIVINQEGSDESFNPLQDFNKMMIGAGIATEGSQTCHVDWDGKKTYIQMGEFKTNFGLTVRPHRQESIIEEK